MVNEEQNNKYPIQNKNNIYLDFKFVNDLLTNYDIDLKINNENIWQQAFIHTSYCQNCKKNKRFAQNSVDISSLPENEEYKDCIPIQEKSNERLEWLGDSILQGVVGMYLESRFINEGEGFLTKIRSKLVKTESLSNFAKICGFDKYIIISQYVEIAGNGRTNHHILEDTFEAFIGAMSVDFGKYGRDVAFNACYKFIVGIIENFVDITELIINDDNYKDQLMRYYQKNYNGKFPIYCEDFKNKEDDKNYSMYVTHPTSNKIVGSGISSTKKKAEQLAAKKALEYFGATNASV